jgi:putative intracellular protease/amidase
MEGDLPVAQLCHAPLVLAAAGTLQGPPSDHEQLLGHFDRHRVD